MNTLQTHVRATFLVANSLLPLAPSSHGLCSTWQREAALHSPCQSPAHLSQQTPWPLWGAKLWHPLCRALLGSAWLPGFGSGEEVMGDTQSPVRDACRFRQMWPRAPDTG